MINATDRDLYFTEDGDFYLNRSDRRLRFSKQKKNELLGSLIKKRLQSNDTDWRLNTIIASNIDAFKGMPQSEEIIEEIKQFVYRAVISDDLVQPESVNIIVLGIIKGVIGIGISIAGTDPSADDEFRINLFYDFRENKFTNLDLWGGIANGTVN